MVGGRPKIKLHNHRLIDLQIVDAQLKWIVIAVRFGDVGVGGNIRQIKHAVTVVVVVKRIWHAVPIGVGTTGGVVVIGRPIDPNETLFAVGQPVAVAIGVVRVKLIFHAAKGKRRHFEIVGNAV